MDKHLIWATTIFLIVVMICGTLIYLNHNSWTLRFEMDNNTKEAIESIEYPLIDYGYENCTFNEATCNYICCDGNYCLTTLMSNDWCKDINYSDYTCNGLIDEDCLQW